ncbi:hypothetical protein DFH06DRAFT_513193 [Mycena polygramma]|nr:hypothetical protein DFH06DRAFT_513193 [Mycena polygramma]
MASWTPIPFVIPGPFPFSPYPHPLSVASNTDAFDTGIDARDAGQCIVCRSSLNVEHTLIVEKGDWHKWGRLKYLGFIPQNAKGITHEARNGVSFCLQHRTAFDKFKFYIRWVPRVRYSPRLVPCYTYIHGLFQIQAFLFINHSRKPALEEYHGHRVNLDPDNTRVPFAGAFISQESMVRASHLKLDRAIPLPPDSLSGEVGYVSPGEWIGDPDYNGEVSAAISHPSSIRDGEWTGDYGGEVSAAIPYPPSGEYWGWTGDYGGEVSAAIPHPPSSGYWQWTADYGGLVSPAIPHLPSSEHFYGYGKWTGNYGSEVAADPRCRHQRSSGQSVAQTSAPPSHSFLFDPSHIFRSPGAMEAFRQQLPQQPSWRASVLEGGGWDGSAAENTQRYLDLMHMELPSESTTAANPWP